MLRKAGISALEIAPTRLWPGWHGASPAAAREAAAVLGDAGFRVSSLQAILFGKPGCKLFGDDRGRRELLDHLSLCADLAPELGANCLVFGAPGSRDLLGRSDADAFTIAHDFFRVAGELYARRGLCLCLEPNPPQYNCQFVNRSTEAARLVEATGSEGFRLHLDTGCLFLAGEDPGEAVGKHASILRHVHFSEPFLEKLERRGPALESMVSGLTRAGYGGWVTLEMKAGADPIRDLTTAVDVLKACFEQESHDSVDFDR